MRASLALLFLCSTSAIGQSAEPQAAVAMVPAEAEGNAHRHVLVEEFTAATLKAGEVKLGSDLEVGLVDTVMIGTDLVSAAVGASTLQAKFAFLESGEHSLAFGVRAAYLNKKTLLWGSAKQHFDKLDARVVRPSIAWTNSLSPRLKLHTFWAKGFGKIEAELSERGRRKLWEAKHPDADYETRDEDTQAPSESPDGEAPTDGTGNVERDASTQESPSQQSIQVQSITGLAQERFQLTGEFARRGGNKVLVTSRIEQSRIEDLKSNFFRLTAAHQWIWNSFQMRLGIGVQYFVLSGLDLDGEKIDEAGVQPASDIGFYWRF
jgi:hypothetical protein